MIPESFIRDLLFRVDLVEIIGRHLPLRRRGSSLVSICPFHSEKNPSFTVNVPGQFYHCFGCGAHGNAISFLMKYLGLSFQDSIDFLAKTIGISTFEEKRIQDSPQKKLIQKKKLHCKILQIALSYYEEKLQNSSVAFNYLKSRGITEKIARKFCLGWADFKINGLRKVFENYNEPILIDVGLVIEQSFQKRCDRFRGRIMFPIRNMDRGDIIAFGGRAITEDHKPKYINTSETLLFSKGRELYGFFEAHSEIKKMGMVIIVEGYMDVISLAQQGIENVVALLGTSVTLEHVIKLFHVSNSLLFCFDGDEAGKKAAWRALKTCLPLLKNQEIVRFLFLPEGHDPDSYIRSFGSNDFQSLLKNSISLSKFLLQELSVRYKISEAEGRTSLLVEAKDLLSLIPNNIYRIQIEHELAPLVHLTANELRVFLKQDMWLAKPLNFKTLKSGTMEIKNTNNHRSEFSFSLTYRLISLLLLYPDLIESIETQEMTILDKEPCLRVAKHLVFLAKQTGARGIKDTIGVVKSGSELNKFMIELEGKSKWRIGLPHPKQEMKDIFRKIKLMNIQKEMDNLAKTGLHFQKDQERYQYLSQEMKNMKK